MKSIVGLKTKSELPKWTENQMTQSSRDIKNFRHIVKDFRISMRKMREFHMKQDCFRRTYFMFRSLIKGALNYISINIFVSVLFSYNVLHCPPQSRGGGGRNSNLISCTILNLFLSEDYILLS